jgi:hypothetical protein
VPADVVAVTVTLVAAGADRLTANRMSKPSTAESSAIASTGSGSAAGSSGPA